jgi:hypothetical protein
VFIRLAAVYVSTFVAVLDSSFAGKALGFLDLGTSGGSAFPRVGGDAELRSGLPPHGLAAATPGCRPEPKCAVLDSSDTKQ